MHVPKTILGGASPISDIAKSHNVGKEEKDLPRACALA
jgi:hypothetical protein